MEHMINWFEIPVSDLQRARTFYETIFDFEMEPMDFPELKMMVFPVAAGNISGALCYNTEFYKPSADGPLLYLNGGDDLAHILKRVEEAGGKIAMAKTQISPEIGYMGIFIDSEGNRIALHSTG